MGRDGRGSRYVPSSIPLVLVPLEREHARHFLLVRQRFVSLVSGIVTVVRGAMSLSGSLGRDRE